MEVEFRNDKLDRLETDPDFDAGFSREIVRAYRRRIQSIRAAADERDLYNVRGHRFKKLKGDREHQYSMRLNDQWRLIIEIKEERPANTVIVVDIEDYH